MRALGSSCAAAVGAAALVFGVGCGDDSPTGLRDGSRRGMNGIRTASGTLTIDPVATVVQGQLVVGGSITCNPVGGVTGPLEALLFASQNHGAISGEGFMAGFVCDGTSQRWEGRVQIFDGHFRPGSAFVSAFVLICDEHGGVCEDVQASSRVLVRRP